MHLQDLIIGNSTKPSFQEYDENCMAPFVLIFKYEILVLEKYYKPLAALPYEKNHSKKIPSKSESCQYGINLSIL